MNRFPHRRLIAVSAAIVMIASAAPASAQRASGRFYRLFGEIPFVTLAQLEEVAGALQLKDEQKATLTKLNDELNDARSEAFQDAQGDFDAMRKAVTKLYAENLVKVNAALDEAQQKRAEEIYVLVNGPTALASDPIAKKLGLTDEQRKKLNDLNMDHVFDVFDAFQDWQGMSEDERAKESDDMIKSRDKSLLAVLTDQQKQDFEKMRGEKIEVDLNKLPMPGQR